ncbi:MAG TPA: hypothetical protein PKJ94_12930, partial [Ferruginibacter sp.]|nr:hypothetical protein [Ferruginibacter sp.]
MKHLSSLNKYFWKYRWHFMLGFVFIILTNYFRILSPQLTGYVVNTVVHSIKAQQDGQAVPVVKESGKNYDFAVQQVITTFEEDPGNRILYAGLKL